VSQSPKYVIVQAGGRGSRLRHHTWNKPKCLVSVQGKPILYHIFDHFPIASFIVIGDYLFDQLENYLSVNPPGVKFQLIRATTKGTASGVADAFALVPPDASVLLMWSDLIIESLPDLPAASRPVVCTTSAFTCRWTVDANGSLREAPSAYNGIPGLFYFREAQFFANAPNEGEFVKWFAANIKHYDLLDCPCIAELGDFAAIEESNDREGFCRFFNNVQVEDEEVVKRVVHPDYESVHQNEVAWYQAVGSLGFRRIPEIIETQPLRMRRIKGRHAYQMHDLSAREQRAVMCDYLDALMNLHDLSRAPVVPDDVRKVYIDKTRRRVEDVAALIPGVRRSSITINGRKCRNPFSEHYQSLFDELLSMLMPDQFTPIHGDPTFSNSLVDDNLRVWFIDPRGYFSDPGIMGDRWYDFAKVYYSAIGGYDAFNRRKFKLYVDGETAEVLMSDSLFQENGRRVFREYFAKDLPRIEVLHGLIWCALSGYARDDMDSVIGAFYLGLYWLEEGLADL
jgi:GTP:adenosylcobinamide-phosphate guanylyltransferase